MSCCGWCWTKQGRIYPNSAGGFSSLDPGSKQMRDWKPRWGKEISVYSEVEGEIRRRYTKVKSDLSSKKSAIQSAIRLSPFSPQMKHLARYWSPWEKGVTRSLWGCRGTEGRQVHAKESDGKGWWLIQAWCFSLSSSCLEARLWLSDKPLNCSELHLPVCLVKS